MIKSFRAFFVFSTYWGSQALSLFSHFVIPGEQKSCGSALKMRSDHIGHILSAIGDKEFGRRGRKNCATLSAEVCSAVSRGANNMLSNVSFYPPSPLACSLSAFQPLLLSYGSFPALSPTPVFLITPSLSEWAALGLLGLLEVYQKHVWRVGGGWWEALRRAAHPLSSLLQRTPPSQWGRKTLSEFKGINLLAFLQDFIFRWIYKQEKTSHPKSSL